MPVFEYVVVDKLKVWLKLEDSIARIKHFLEQGTRIDHHRALLGLLELNEIIQRHDLRSDYLIELEKLKNFWQKQSNNPQISQRALTQYLDEFELLMSKLHELSGRPGTHLQEIEWLQLLKQKMLLPGGASESESSYLRWWLDQSAAQRLSDMKLWLSPLQTIFSTNELLLRFLRQTVSKERVQSQNGQYNRALHTHSDVMLLRVVIPVADIIPEFSANKIKLGISFYQMHGHRRLLMIDSVPFELHFCTLTQA